MEKLNENWLTEGLVDFEYKKYMLLAYLQHISKHFDEQKLYPFLSDLILQHQNLIILQKNKDAIKDHFPKQISKIDLENFTIEYERLMNDEQYMLEIESIIEFALPNIEKSMSFGMQLYNYVEDSIEIQPIGLMPLNTEIGYLLLNNGKHFDIEVYKYKLTIFEKYNEKYRSIQTQYLDSYAHQINNTFNSVKLDLIRRNKELPNPATFAIASRLKFPVQETLLPIAKRCFVRFIGKN